MYKRPYDPKRPQVCFDERPKQLVAEVRVPLPRCPGRPAHYDYEYKRNGVANIFMMFEPAEAKRIADKLEIHYTPKHGSWLNMAEIEMSVLSRQCLAERMADMHRLENEVLAWELKRNTKNQKVNWRFTTEDARIKLKRLYPSIEV